MLNITDNSRNKVRVLVFVQASWGELQWILPVCHYLKFEREVEVVVYVNAFTKKTILNGNENVEWFLKKSVSVVLDRSDFLPGFLRGVFRYLCSVHKGHAISARLLRFLKRRVASLLDWVFNRKIASRLFFELSPDVVVRDIGKDTSDKKELMTLAKSKGKRVVITPPGATIFMEGEFSDSKEGIFGDLLLCTSVSMQNYFRKVGGDLDKVVVGNPRFDHWWMEYIRSNVPTPANVSRLEPDQYLVLFITRGPHIVYLSKSNFEYLVESTLENILLDPNAFVIIRPHPRQSISSLCTVLDKFDNSRWSIDMTDIAVIADDISFVVSMWSSAILDALASGIPVIEFYRFEDTTFEWLTDSNGDCSTVNREYGIAYPANTAEELLSISRWIRKNREEAKEKLLFNLNLHLVQSANLATIACAEAILGCDDSTMSAREIGAT